MSVDPTTLTAFAVASAAVVLVPGPNLIYIVTRGLSQGTRAALVSAAGVEAATLVYVAATAVGVSEVISRSPALFTSLRVAGAGYLVYLAIMAIRHPPRVQMDRPGQPRDMWRTFRDGAVVNLLNPKVALFFVAFLPQFVDRTRPDAVTAQLFVLGATFFALALALDVVYATLSGAAARFVIRSGRRIGWVRWPVAAVYLALAGYAVAS